MDLEAVKVTTQVVAGINYVVLYKADDSYLLARVYVNLDGDAELTNLQTENVTADSPVELPF